MKNITLTKSKIRKIKTSINRARKIRADIFWLTGRHPEVEEKLTASTDQIYNYINHLEHKIL